jgi:hypothetical protein
MNAIRQPLPMELVRLLAGLGAFRLGALELPAFKGVPQLAQNLALLALSRPQLGQFIGE